MWLRRPTIVTDTLGVRDHVRHRETALIVEGSPESYLEALRWIFDPQNQAAVQRLRHNARRVVQEQFSFEKHIARLLNIMDETIGDNAHSGD
jgi:glycosyltransferase involved in cell wall biosynthesis